MPIKEPITRTHLPMKQKEKDAYEGFSQLITELNTKPLNVAVVEFINQCIDEINVSTLTETKFIKLVLEKQAAIIKLVQKEHKLVLKNHYRNMWGLWGISTFGIPIGVAIGVVKNNMGLLGLGFPLGIAIGVFMGSYLDKKAMKEGLQLTTTVKHFI